MLYYTYINITVYHFLMYLYTTYICIYTYLDNSMHYLFNIISKIIYPISNQSCIVPDCGYIVSYCRNIDRYKDNVERYRVISIGMESIRNVFMAILIDIEAICIEIRQFLNVTEATGYPVERIMTTVGRFCGGNGIVNH